MVGIGDTLPTSLHTEIVSAYQPFSRFASSVLTPSPGSFGTYPRVVQEALRSFQEKTEATPDQFICYEYPKLLDETRGAIATILNAPRDNVVLVSNATIGVNTI